MQENPQFLPNVQLGNTTNNNKITIMVCFIWSINIEDEIESRSIYRNNTKKTNI